MSTLKVLFIGGTGVISSACVRAAADEGHEVSVLNRGLTRTRPLQDEVRSHIADVRDVESVRRAVGSAEFDVIADFTSFTPAHVQLHMNLWSNRVGQYIFISSASAYQTPPSRLPVVESTPLDNPHWQYSREKAACEELLMAEHRGHGFPATVVRPSHTYDRTLVPFDGGWTVVDRVKRGLPIVVHGDGTSLWTLTHHEDFATAFAGILGEPKALGEAYHITSDDTYTWNRIAELMGAAANASPDIVHVASDSIAAIDPEWGASLLGDKAHSMVFDNTKIKQIVPGWRANVTFEVGAREIVDWHMADERRRVVDPDVNAAMDALIRRFRV